jgi:hypothetical protein
LLRESWNERVWAEGEPIDPSPTVDQAINGGYPWLEIECSRCKTPNEVDLVALTCPSTTFVHDLAGRPSPGDFGTDRTARRSVGLAIEDVHHSRNFAQLQNERGSDICVPCLKPRTPSNLLRLHVARRLSLQASD